MSSANPLPGLGKPGRAGSRHLLLANGALVRLLRKLPSRSHAVYPARTADTENLVVVKTGGSPGSLSREASVLRWLAGSGVSVPVPAELLTDHRGGLVLVLRFVSGNHPLSATDFAEAGRTLATLHAVSLSPGLQALARPGLPWHRPGCQTG